MPPEDLYQLEIQLHRFNKLLAEVMRGAITRNSFQPWEVEILLDMEQCQIDRRRRLEILRQYQRAVGKQMERGSGPPMKLSEFLIQRAQRHEAKAPHGSSNGSSVDSEQADQSEI
ncbi:MAG: hypothetical protein ABSG03_21850 [Bryobacteraceae bacterium]|jgi:hypothetical protein